MHQSTLTRNIQSRTHYTLGGFAINAFGEEEKQQQKGIHLKNPTPTTHKKNSRRLGSHLKPLCQHTTRPKEHRPT